MGRSDYDTNSDHRIDCLRHPTLFAVYFQRATRIPRLKLVIYFCVHVIENANTTRSLSISLTRKQKRQSGI